MDQSFDKIINEAALLGDRQFREFLDGLPVAAYTCDQDGLITYYNPNAANFWGRSPALNDPADRFCGSLGLFDKDGNGVDRDDCWMAQAIRNDTTYSGMEVRISRPDGQMLSAMTHINPIHDEGGNLVGAVNVMVRMTDNDRVNSVLRQAMEITSAKVGQDFFNTLANFLCDTCGVSFAFIGDLDRDDPDMMHALAVSHKGRATKQFSYSLASTPCANVVGQQFCYEAEAVCEKYPDDLMLQGMGMQSYMGIPLWSSEHKPLGIIALMHSERFPASEEAESILRLVSLRAAAELERKMKDEEQRAIQLQMQNIQKLESLGVLAGGIAHDFNNQLTSILGNASIALRKLPPDSPIRVLLEKIEKAAERSAELTQQMLAYSGKSMVQEEAVSLDELIREMMGLLGASISKKAMVDIDLHKSRIKGDSSQLRQLIMNLVTNASESLGEESGTLKVRTGECWMEADALKSPYTNDIASGEYAFIEISDTGTGIDSEALHTIFDPFYSTKFAGRGLGLAASLGIVRSHEGAIIVESEVGRGSCFKVYLPQYAAISASPSADFDVDVAAPPSTVLVIDDEPDLRDIAKFVLEGNGYEVLTASNGEEGLQKFSDNQALISAVLLDLTMPGLSGLEVLERLYEMAPNVPVIIMSGFSELEIKAQCEHLRPVGILKKPFHPDELGDRVSDALRSTAIH